MNIYLISQNINNDYDTYDSAVVIADTEEEARNIHPGSEDDWFEEDRWDDENKYTDWVTRKDINKIKVQLIGIAKEGSTKGVVCSSFNAG